MTPEQFTYWLQGKLEGREPSTVTENEVKMIQEHLRTVFHKVTPSNAPTPNIFPPVPNFPGNQVIC